MNRYGDRVRRQDNGEADLRDKILGIYVRILEAADNFGEQIDGMSEKFDNLNGNIKSRLAALSKAD